MRPRVLGSAADLASHVPLDAAHALAPVHSSPALRQVASADAFQIATLLRNSASLGDAQLSFLDEGPRKQLFTGQGEAEGDERWQAVEPPPPPPPSPPLPPPPAPPQPPPPPPPPQQAVDWLAGFFKPPPGPWSPPPKQTSASPPATSSSPVALSAAGSSPGGPSAAGSPLVPGARAAGLQTPPRSTSSGLLAPSAAGPSPPMSRSVSGLALAAPGSAGHTPGAGLPRRNSAPMHAAHGVHSRWRLDGYRVLVTGSTQGIGLAAAREVLALGGSVCVTARRASDVSGVVQQLRAAAGEEAGRVWGLTSDVSTGEGRRALIARVEEVWGGVLDGLVNNAGTNVRRSVLDASQEEYDSIVSTNMDSAYWICKEAYRLLVRSSRPTIVNVSSVAGLTSTGSGAIYAMSKAAVVQLTKALACEWAAVGIRVNCVAPWVTMTPLLAQAIERTPGAADKAAHGTPLKRVAQPEEIASAIAFLLLPASSYVTAHVLVADGGLSAQGFAGPCVSE